MERVETVIIGGGQAGLAMSYHLRRLGQEHIVLENKLKSSFLYGVGEDAEYLAERICATNRGELPPTASSTLLPRGVKDDA